MIVSIKSEICAGVHKSIKQLFVSNHCFESEKSSFVINS